MVKLKLGEVCAGYGGLGLAVESVFDAELAWYSEFEESAEKIMQAHWPDVPNYGDMTAIQWAPNCPHGIGHRVEVFRLGANTDYAAETFYRCINCGWELPVDQRPANVPYPVHILSGGTPCQDLSHAGRRRGMTEGTRSNLWVSMREAIAIIKPTYVVWENVRGAYSAKADSEMEHCPGCMGTHEQDGKHFLRALGRVLGDLSDLGYDAQWRGLRAADVDAPHGRFRVFILATRRNASANTASLGSESKHHGDERRTEGCRATGVANGASPGPRGTGAATANPARVGGHETIERDGRGAQILDRASVPHESNRDALRTGSEREAAADSNSRTSRRAKK